MERRKIEGCFARIFAREKLVKDHAQAIDIGTRCGLRPAILFGSSIARRAKRDSVSGLSRLEAAGYTKIDDGDLAAWCAHDVARLQIAKDDWWLLSMQVFQYCAELYTDMQYLAQWDVALRLVIEIFF